MFLGHALLAFAVAALVADWRGWSARRALAVGLVAGAFGALPDVDVAYAAVALDLFAVTADADPEAFWDATREIHRTVTHSLVVAAVAAPAFGLAAVRSPESSGIRWGSRIVAVGALASLVGVAYGTSGVPGGMVMGLFALTGFAVGLLCPRLTDLGPRTVSLAALAGLALHPWGDLVTGSPPGLFYPFEFGLFGGRVLLHGDPTLHLLSAFALELATVWFAAIAVSEVLDLSWRGLIDRRAGFGVAYGVAAVVLVPPTLAVSYQFVFSILSVGLVIGIVSLYSADVGLPTAPQRRALLPLGFQRPAIPGVSEEVLDVFGVVLTALASISFALVSYGAVYLVVTAP